MASFSMNFFGSECLAKLEIHKRVALSVAGNRLGHEKNNLLGRLSLRWDGTYSLKYIEIFIFARRLLCPSADNHAF
jgi:hypothetical protein